MYSIFVSGIMFYNVIDCVKELNKILAGLAESAMPGLAVVRVPFQVKT
jgi:hypothetical protein